MTKVNIKTMCEDCDGTGEELECNCVSRGRTGAWECARGYCNGELVKVECFMCKGKGYRVIEADLAEEE
jgi:hypothetical protein